MNSYEVYKIMVFFCEMKMLTSIIVTINHINHINPTY